MGGRRLGSHQGELQGVRPGTRPLTAGEVVENWDEVLGPRCFARWRSEDKAFQLSDIDDAAAARARVEIRSVSRRDVLFSTQAAAAQRLEDASNVADALAWRPDALRALRAAQRAGRTYRGAPLVLVRHDLLGLSTVDHSGDVLAGWRGVVRTVLPRADVACRGALDVADELLDGHAEQTLCTTAGRRG